MIQIFCFLLCPQLMPPGSEQALNKYLLNDV